MSGEQRYRFLRALPVWAQPLGILALGLYDGHPAFGAKMAWKVFRWQWSGRR